MPLQPIRYNQFEHHDIWSKAQDYLLELSVYERIMAESLFVNNYELALKAADTIVPHISFLLKDVDPKNANKVLRKGLASDKYKSLTAKVTLGLKYAMIAKSGVTNANQYGFYAYNIARELNVEIKNAIYEAELYFKKGGNPNTALSTGLSGA